MNLILQILRQISFFAPLTEEEHMAIINHIQMQYFPAHYLLVHKGGLGDAMYIIKSGMLRVYDESGEMANLGEGDFFGEMALIDSQPRNANVETLSDCEIFVLKKEDFVSLLTKSPEIARKVNEAYQNRKISNLKHE
jgi:CRP-like cAMP-binding protein